MVWKNRKKRLLSLTVLPLSYRSSGGKFAAGAVDTGGNFAAGVVDTGGKFATGVVDTGGAPLLANISANFRKKLKRS